MIRRYCRFFRVTYRLLRTTIGQGDILPLSKLPVCGNNTHRAAETAQFYAHLQTHDDDSGREEEDSQYGGSFINDEAVEEHDHEPAVSDEGGS